ncbi:MAG: L,D-transpeptidase [Spirochaetes bacterium]|nr:L,D-transpeptidase [Spirochaetota bacterium]
MNKILVFIAIILAVILIIIKNTNIHEKSKFNSKMIKKILKKYKPSYFIYVKKKDYRLYIMDHIGRVVRSFDIAIGRKKDFARKIYKNDNGTPEGLYRVKEILSLAAGTNTYSYKRLKSMNTVYFKASEGHYLWGNPHKDAGQKAYGPRFFRLNYPNRQDIKDHHALVKKGRIPKNENGTFPGLGGGIGIHGTNDPPSIRHMISSGCIRMLNSELVLLDDYLKVGSPVYIEK